MESFGIKIIEQFDSENLEAMTREQAREIVRHYGVPEALSNMELERIIIWNERGNDTLGEEMDYDRSDLIDCVESYLSEDTNRYKAMADILARSGAVSDASVYYPVSHALNVLANASLRQWYTDHDGARYVGIGNGHLATYKGGGYWDITTVQGELICAWVVADSVRNFVENGYD